MLQKCDDLAKMTPRSAKMLPKCDDLAKMTPHNAKVLPKCDDIMKMPRWGWSVPALCYTTVQCSTSGKGGVIHVMGVGAKMRRPYENDTR